MNEYVGSAVISRKNALRQNKTPANAHRTDHTLRTKCGLRIRCSACLVISYSKVLSRAGYEKLRELNKY